MFVVLLMMLHPTQELEPPAISVRFTVYKTIFTDGVARMRPVEGTLPIPANSELVMKRGGIHLVLSAPEHQLIAGEAVEMTLIFEDGVQIVASAKVLHLNEKLTDHHHSDVDGVSRE